MNVRNFQETDIEQLKKIHENYYAHEFSLDEFNKQFLNFVIIEDNNIIVAAGGVRAIAESVIMTNKDVNNRLKRAALYQMLAVQEFLCKTNNINQLHAFVQDVSWKKILIDKVGFKPCKGDAIFLEVE